MNSSDILPVLLSIFMLIIVLVLAYFTTKWIGKKGMAYSNARFIKIIDRAVISPDKSLVIVTVEGKTLLLGVSTNHIDKLCELENFQHVNADVVNNSPSISMILLRAFMKSFGLMPDKKQKTGEEINDKQSNG